MSTGFLMTGWLSDTECCALPFLSVVHKSLNMYRMQDSITRMRLKIFIAVNIFMLLCAMTRSDLIDLCQYFEEICDFRG